MLKMLKGWKLKRLKSLKLKVTRCGGESRALGPLGAPGPDVKVRGERILLKGLRGECQGPGPLGAPGPDVKVRGDRVLHHGTNPT